jgi:hypothetical protein
MYLFVGVTRSLRRQELFVVVGCGSGGVKMVGGSGVGEGVESLALAGLAESESLLLDMVPGGSGDPVQFVIVLVVVWFLQGVVCGLEELDGLASSAVLCSRIVDRLLARTGRVRHGP